MSTTEVLRSIYNAVSAGRTEEALALLDSNPGHLHVETPFGSWLHIAATGGDLELVRQLVLLGIELNRKGGTFGGSAVNVAASAGHYPIVEFLLEQGAELDTSEPERNPLFAAIHGGHLQVAKLLVAHGIDYHVKYSGEYMERMGAIDFAIERGQSAIVAFLQSLPGGRAQPAA